MDEVYDYRSDTVTKPLPEMWETLRNLSGKDLGDDVSQEDPTVNELEKQAAQLVNKEAALFVTSGTQGNLLALLAQTNPGDEILLEEYSHIYKWEVGGLARLGGLVSRTFPSQKGIFNPEDLQALIHDSSDIHEVTTRLICLENTHNYHGGVILPLDLFQQVKQFATRNQLKVHLDGARIFNAVVASNTSISNYTQNIDSIQFCLSKGLSCPVGSILAGSTEMIKRARKFRKMIGGGWRQAGILASMGLIALKESSIERLKEDHLLIQKLAQGLQDENDHLLIEKPQTNIMMLGFEKNINLLEIEHKLSQAGILVHTMGPRLRFVSHSGLTSEDIDNSIPIITKVLQNY